MTMHEVIRIFRRTALAVFAGLCAWFLVQGLWEGFLTMFASLVVLVLLEIDDRISKTAKVTNPKLLIQIPLRTRLWILGVSLVTLLLLAAWPTLRHVL